MNTALTHAHKDSYITRAHTRILQQHKKATPRTALHRTAHRTHAALRIRSTLQRSAINNASQECMCTDAIARTIIGCDLIMTTLIQTNQNLKAQLNSKIIKIFQRLQCKSQSFLSSRLRTTVRGRGLMIKVRVEDPCTTEPKTD